MKRTSETTPPLKVFLCHAHADRDAVRALYTRLTKDGVDAWLDKERLLPGQDWELEIRKAVREADVVVVCLSKQFNQAGFRQKEVRLALDTAMEKPEGEIFIIPARLEECDMLESLRKWHWVDLFEDDGYEMLMRALRARANTIGTTLQIKRSWLPKVTTPQTRIDKPKEKILESPKPEANKPKSSDKLNTSIIIALIGLVGTIIAGLLGSPLIEKWLSPIIVSTPIVFDPHPEPSDYIDAFGVPMRLVSAGEFIMGDNVNYYYPEFYPVQTVMVKDFYIDKYEITNALYKKCVDAFVCDPPIYKSSDSRASYYGDPKYDNYPVIYVSWNMASTYCAWRKTRLPTDVEWEKAARGTDGRTFPWGEVEDCIYANFGPYNYQTQEKKHCVGDTSRVDSYSIGRSIYGVYNLAGNVAEWVSDEGSGFFVSLTPYPSTPIPESLTYHFIRGGSWDRNDIKSYWKSLTYSTITLNDYGFRCAKDALP